MIENDLNWLHILQLLEMKFPKIMKQGGHNKVHELEKILSGRGGTTQLLGEIFLLKTPEAPFLGSLQNLV